MTGHRLTLPSYEVGACDIRVDGHRVGTALGRFDDWQAHLWPVADGRAPANAETITRPTLRALRTELRRRLDETGPWWTEEDPPDAR